MGLNPNPAFYNETARRRALGPDPKRPATGVPSVAGRATTICSEDALDDHRTLKIWKSDDADEKVAPRFRDPEIIGVIREAGRSASHLDDNGSNLRAQRRASRPHQGA